MRIYRTSTNIIFLLILYVYFFVYLRKIQKILNYPDIETAIDNATIIRSNDILDLLFEYTKYKDAQVYWSTFVRICNSPKLTPNAFVVGLKNAYKYGGSDDGNSRELFARVLSPKYRRYRFTSTERKEFDKLPLRLTIYRGLSLSEYEDCEQGYDSFGISWTTRREVAEFFAFRNDIPGIVVKMEIDKRYALAYILDRNEYEIIFDEDLGGSYNCPKVVTKRPTRFYYNYLKSRT